MFTSSKSLSNNKTAEVQLEKHVQDCLACKDNHMSAVEGDFYFSYVDSENYCNVYKNDTLLFRYENVESESTFWERFNESDLIVKICAGYLAGVFIAAVGMVLFCIFQR